MQPVVHVEREQTEVRQVVQPIVEKEQRPTLVTKTSKEVDLGTKHVKAWLSVPPALNSPL